MWYVWVGLCSLTLLSCLGAWWQMWQYTTLVRELEHMHAMYRTLCDVAYEVIAEPDCEQEQFIQINRERVYLATDETSPRSAMDRMRPYLNRARQMHRPRNSVRAHSTQNREQRWLALPVSRNNFWISSLFGLRKEPSGKQRYHYGVDLAASRGTPVYASASGTVLYAGWCGGFGKLIVIGHANGWKTRYAHLYDTRVQQGVHVTAGSRIGSVGDTGHVRKDGRDASHLHFEVEYNGKRRNPLHYLNLE